MRSGFTIVGIGEAVFDVFPGQHRLGGAPLNLALHAQQLGQPHEGRGVLVSRVGQDALGDQLIEQLRERGLDTAYIQTDPDRPTGRVYVDFAEDGSASYDIERHVAWDVLQFDPDVEDLARQSDAICFGTLAQRDAQGRNTIHRFLDTARRSIRLFDVNLRRTASQGGEDFYDQRVIERSLDAATALKANMAELPEVCHLLGLDAPDGAAGVDTAARTLMARHELNMVVVTRGRDGTVIYAGNQRHEGEPAEYPPADGADDVGAGDACAAAILVGAVSRMPPAGLANFANHVGAFVASQPGATPRLPDSILAMSKP